MANAEQQLLAITSLDGRYADKVSELTETVSEFGLIKYRVAVETGWLSVLGSGILPDVPAFDPGDHAELDDIYTHFQVTDAAEVKTIEKTTNHDVKAVEMWLRNRLSGEQWRDRLELIHFGCTSEDINNLAFAMIVRDAHDFVLRPGIEEIKETLGEKATQYADTPLLARTHGQPATPTTVGKELAVFADRLYFNLQRLGQVTMFGKFNGATGNYAAAHTAYPEVNWPEVNKKFVESLGFTFNPATTQIESHDWMAAYFNELAAANNIMTDLSLDNWLYIMNSVYSQKAIAGEVGSSTMPHKVNPIDFENAEANFGMANAVLNWLSNKLTKSRLQRDLSDSSAQRTIGTAFGHTLVAQKSLKRGIGKVNPNEEHLATELDNNWAVLTEAVQTVMRRYQVEGAYDIIKQASRGKEISEADYLRLVASLDIPAEARQRLLDLTPASYTGYAGEIARAEL